VLFCEKSRKGAEGKIDQAFRDMHVGLQRSTMELYRVGQKVSPY